MIRQDKAGLLFHICHFRVLSLYVTKYFIFLSFRLSLTESELAMSETKINELGSLLQKARDDQNEMARFHQSEIRREREVRFDNCRQKHWNEDRHIIV